MLEENSPRPSLSRRRFLAALGQIAAVLAAAPFFYRLARKDDFIAAAVRRQLPFLVISDDQLARFAADFRNAASQGQRRVIAFCAVFAPLYRFQQRRGRTTPLPDLERNIAQTFLLSSDLFTRNASETAPLQYVRLFEPYRYPCSNPFAKRSDPV